MYCSTYSKSEYHCILVRYTHNKDGNANYNSIRKRFLSTYAYYIIHGYTTSTLTCDLLEHGRKWSLSSSASAKTPSIHSHSMSPVQSPGFAPLIDWLIIHYIAHFGITLHKHMDIRTTHWAYPTQSHRCRHEQFKWPVARVLALLHTMIRERR